MKHSGKDTAERVKSKRNKIIVFVVFIVAIMVYLISKDLSKENKMVHIPSKQYDETSEDAGNTKYTIDQLTKAVLENNTGLVENIISSKSVDINGKDSKDQYPIEKVLVLNNSEMAKILLEAGADPYVKTSGGDTVYDIVMNGDSKHMKTIFEDYKK
ncbi:MAG TPA: hypothetical protein DCM73_02330 [Clostridiales bacterium]|nr:hypothetical protein [Clostridiales bacterium]